MSRERKRLIPGAENLTRDRLCYGPYAYVGGKVLRDYSVKEAWQGARYEILWFIMMKACGVWVWAFSRLPKEQITPADEHALRGMADWCTSRVLRDWSSGRRAT